MLAIGEWSAAQDDDDLSDMKKGNCFYLTLRNDPSKTVYKVYLDNDTKEAMCVSEGIQNQDAREFAAKVCLAFGYKPREVICNG